MMSKYDVIIVGGGPGGLSNAAILAKNGKKVLLMEKDGQVGGRAIEVPYKGHKINLSWHQIEEPGSGLTKIFQYVGKELRQGPMARGLPLYIDGKWTRMQDLYAKERGDLKKIVKEIVEDLSWDEIENLDDQPIRPWLRKRTRSDGIVTLFEVIHIYEGITLNWWDHSLSENLWMRKLHYTEKNIISYAFSPLGGYKKVWNDLADGVLENGGEIRLNAPVRDIVIENGKVKGVEVETHGPIMATDYPETEMIEAPCVISTLPCWNALDIVDESLLPGWYVDQIKFLARDELRSAWLGIYAGVPETVSFFDQGEMPGWWQGSRTGKYGIFGIVTDLTYFDPSISPRGEHLFAVWACIDQKYIRLPRRELERIFSELEMEVEELFPIYKKRLWKVRHIGYNPTYTPLWRPGAVGRYRPDVEVPAVEGLYFAGDTFRGRSAGMDRAGRIAMTVSEKVLGRRIPEFKDSRHY